MTWVLVSCCFTALPAVSGAAEEPPLSIQDGMPILGDGHATCSTPAGISAYTLDGKCAQEMPSQVLCNAWQPDVATATYFLGSYELSCALDVNLKIL